MIFLFFCFCNENLCIYFWKRLLVYHKLGFSSKKISKGSNSVDFLDFLWNFAHALFLKMPKKSVKSIFSELVNLRKQHKSKTKKIYTQVFRHCYVQHMRKISRKNSKHCFRCSSWKSWFFKQKTLSSAKIRSLSKITHQYFSMHNQYNQVIIKFVLKSNIQDIHKP